MSEDGDGAGAAETDIRKLDPHTVDQIAAGEVVERPASVVKELVENALDAGADRIAVEVAGDGTDRVAVRDDGRGMTEADVRAAVRKHTTSKLRDVSELSAGVGTLGFRGEALATIGAVSRTTVTTRPRATRASNGAGDDGPDGDSAGDHGAGATELRLEGGDVIHVGPAGRGPGTTIEVEDLFYNTPARRKYLASETTEFAHVNRVVTRYALANPDVAVSLAHDGTEVFATEGQGDLRAALLAVYGREVAEAMIRVDADPDAGPLDDVRGFVSHPETTRSTREYVSTFVNDRYVEEAALREAILAGYGTQLAADRFPFAVLFVDLPGDAVDVNVHPRKLAVRFDDEAGVRRGVERAVRDALLDAGLVRSGAPRGRSAPGDATIAPGSGDSDANDRAPGPGSANGDVADSAGDGHERGDAETPSGTERESTAGAGPADATGDPPEAGGDADAGAGPTSTVGSGSADETGSETADESGERDARKFAGPSANARLGGDAAPAAGSGVADEGTESGSSPDGRTAFDRLPALRVLGQLHDDYVVAEAPDGLVLIDQHAADERVNYERLCAAVAERRASQSLVAPVEVSLTAGEAAALDDTLPALRELGFEVEREGQTAVVGAVPAVLGETLDPSLLRDALSHAVGGDAPHGDPVDSAADAILADLACYPSITGNTSLSEGRVVDLLAALDDCENPWACPHGRPVVVQVSDEELDDRFERDYPGHQVRRPEE